MIETAPLKDDVCALVAEPVQGEGGFINPPPGYWEKVRKICDDNGIVFIDDEVQTGFGRTGKMFAIEHWNVVPDMIVSGKGLSLGMPLGGVTGKAEIMATPPPASLGGTFGGNPVCCAGALESIKMTKKALPNTKMINKVEKKRLNEWKAKYEVVGDVRGIGAMMAIELVKTKASKEVADRADEGHTAELLQEGPVHPDGWDIWERHKAAPAAEHRPEAAREGPGHPRVRDRRGVEEGRSHLGERSPNTFHKPLPFFSPSLDAGRSARRPKRIYSGSTFGQNGPYP